MVTLLNLATVYTLIYLGNTILPGNTNNKQRVTLFLNPALVKHTKAQAVIDGLSLTSLIKKALVDYLPH